MKSRLARRAHPDGCSLSSRWRNIAGVACGGERASGTRDALAISRTESSQ
ncbi:hypothetical protein ACCUM_4211 [Candidatus Accumulibacter phosphatis]|uniref:Uncharacterized protein n=1 Tax=Candidatus Accumulibacter phosphatis TaxID=327160 RepID=A0A5S4EM97_9PROT|nr:hypothetical protein ACCUM_4211 [Candidatus Accumulibacter phosphatis]